MIPNFSSIVLRIFTTATILVVSSAGLNPQNAVENVVAGKTKVTMIKSYKGTTKLSEPTQAVVYDFKVPSDVITIDKSPVARVTSYGPIAQLKGEPGQETSPTAVAANVQAAFSETLVKEMKKASIPTTRASGGAASDPPANTLTVCGEFTAVKQGKKARRILIGFGSGASDVKAHVVVSMMTTSGPVVLAEFDLSSASGKMPGAVASAGMAPIAGAAVSAGTDGRSSVKSDASRMAKVVAQQVESIMKTQQWATPTAQRQQTQQRQASLAK